MTYKIIHKTTYRYKNPVSVGNHVACLTPRCSPRQHLTRHELRISPAAKSTERTDYFGNQLRFFTVQEPHNRLVVEARSEVEVNPSERPHPLDSPPWERVAKALPEKRDPESLEAFEFCFESPRIRSSAQLASYALQSFTPECPFIAGLLDLTERIYRDFKFDRKATSVRTSTEEVFRKRRGVCQDFAHLQIACLRSLNLPARYVSGYLRTFTAPGRPRLVGADASHAWVSAYCPGFGWMDVDPTNDVVPSLNHVTLGWGRDYGDVSPLRGLILGGRDHTLKVNVDVIAVEDYEKG
jgi:transglutaminase-like putative cysteine protease